MFSFRLSWVMTGIMGLLMSGSSFLCMNYAGPTTYAIMGSLNKVPLTILGFMLFSDPVNFENVISVSFSIFAGMIYSKAKYDENLKSGGGGGGHHK